MEEETLETMQDLKKLKENDIEAYEIIIKLVQKLREIGWSTYFSCLFLFSFFIICFMNSLSSASNLLISLATI